MSVWVCCANTKTGGAAGIGAPIMPHSVPYVRSSRTLVLRKLLLRGKKRSAGPSRARGRC